MIRNLRAGDSLPDWVDLVFKKLDSEWIWVLEEREQIKVVLVAAPIHDIVLLCRVQALQPESKMWWKQIMKRVSADCRARGFSTYMVSTLAEDKASRGLNAFFSRHGAQRLKEGVCYKGEWRQIG